MANKIIINKFGGGILTKEYIPHMKKRTNEQIAKGYKSIAVVSAMPKMTDNLLAFLSGLKENYNSEVIDNYVNEIRNKHFAIIEEIIKNSGYQKNAKSELEKALTILREKLVKIKEVNNKVDDQIVSFGEKLSAIIFTHYLNSVGIKANKILAEDIPIITDNNFKNANIDYKISEKNIKEKFKKLNGVFVIPGFTGITKTGEITTLGRGGTDTTACFIGAALDAEKVVLWKDVGGVLSADPRIIKGATTIPFINYYEAEEAGKIIHDKAIQYIKIHKTKVEVASIINPKLKTTIGEIKNKKIGAKLINVKKDLFYILINDDGIKLNDLLILVSNIFKKYKTDITLISNTHYSLQIVADNKNNQLEKILEELKTKVKDVEMTKASMIFAVGLFNAKDVSNFNDLLVKQNTDLLISAFYSENCYRMEAIINTNDINKVVKAVYKKFIK